MTAPRPNLPRCPACGRVLLLVWGRDVCCNVACSAKGARR